MKHAKFVPFLLCMVALMATGCVYEDMGHCYSTLRFSYTGDTGDEGEFDKIDKLDLYVFDENHQIVREDLGPYTLTEAELSAKEVTLLLPPGKNYRVVCIGNAGENTRVAELTTGTYSTTKLHHPAVVPTRLSEDRHRDVKTLDHLYNGTKGFQIPAAGKTTESIELESAHANMSVTVIGYTEDTDTRADEGFGLAMEHKGLPAWTDFDNKHSRHLDHAESVQSMSQFPEATPAEEGYIHEYSVMRDVSGSTIHLFDSAGNEIVQDGILPIDVDRYIEEVLIPKGGEDPYVRDGNEKTLKLEAVIPIQVEFLNLGVVVTIPPWAIKDVHPGYN